jgi:hypothetical protein
MCYQLFAVKAMYSCGMEESEINERIGGESSKYTNILSWCNEEALQMLRNLPEGNIHTFYQSYFNQWTKMRVHWYDKRILKSWYLKFLQLVFSKAPKDDFIKIWEKKVTDDDCVSISKNCVGIGILECLLSSLEKNEELLPLKELLEKSKRLFENNPISNLGLISCAPSASEFESQISKVIHHTYHQVPKPLLQLISKTDGTIIFEVCENQWEGHFKVVDRIDWLYKKNYFSKELPVVKMNGKWYLELDYELGGYIKARLGISLL